MSHVYGHARFGIPVGSRTRTWVLRMQGWIKAKPVLHAIAANDEIPRETRSTTVEALVEGQRWNVNT